eukprot:CAMPEP_0174869090 /NCGR_PEP_ID=MMETSP1114-20130205/67253_1 /TAXON_ID=312471 /ORGANISM="Neobodo designis, Strain CCAP 1951/1" /LENGTH=108 /DNA_ID=CAMNT_0016104323 /DNA_START=43 /DNA_END=366 /DNA_ORIENTATION=+
MKSRTGRWAPPASAKPTAAPPANAAGAPEKPVSAFAGDASVARYYAQRRDIWPLPRHSPTEESGPDVESSLDDRLVMTKRAWCEASFFGAAADIAGCIGAVASRDVTG